VPYVLIIFDYPVQKRPSRYVTTIRARNTLLHSDRGVFRTVRIRRRRQQFPARVRGVVPVPGTRPVGRTRADRCTRWSFKFQARTRFIEFVSKIIRRTTTHVRRTISIVVIYLFVERDTRVFLVLVFWKVLTVFTPFHKCYILLHF